MLSKSTKFKLFKNVPLDNTYTNTILFASGSEQNTYFANLDSMTLDEQSYQRVNSNKLMIAKSSDELYNYNYLMFQNPSSGNFKWYYAFINEINYVNDNTCEVLYEIDVMQTWLFDFEYGKCYVEREHVEDDTVGLHTVNEGMDIGEYTIASQMEYTTGRGMLISIATTENGSMNNGVYTGLFTAGYSESNYGALNDVLSQYKDKPEQVAQLIMCSDKMVNGAFDETITVGRVKTFSDQFGNRYKPINNKLYCYPFCLFTIDNYNGESEEFHWEDFVNTNVVTFQWSGTPTPSPCMIAFPLSYKQSDGTQSRQYAITYDNFPMCPWTSDTFRAWVSQIVPKTLNNIGATIASTFVTSSIENANASLHDMTKANNLSSAIAGNARAGRNAQTAINTISQIANTAIDYRYNSIHSKSIGGTIQNAGMNFRDLKIGFRATEYTIKPEFARIIDDYFTRYGYRVNRYKVPNLTGREKFNYIKTRNCTILGNLPNSARAMIEQITNNGISFWHTTDVGRYTTNNIIG